MQPLAPTCAGVNMDVCVHTQEQIRSQKWLLWVSFLGGLTPFASGAIIKQKVSAGPESSLEP